MTVELYAPDTKHGNTMTDDDVNGTEYSFWGDFPTIENAIEAAESNGCGIWLTSSEERGRYTGKITVRAGANPIYEPI